MKDTTVLCGANSYEQKYYFNQDFKSLPQSIRDELQIMCVMYTEDVGGVLTMEFDEKGNLEFRVTSESYSQRARPPVFGRLQTVYYNDDI